MLISNKLVYFDLQKTGSSHMLKVLSGLPSLNSTILGKHALYHTIPDDLISDFQSILKIGTVRNPWDWYVSIWAFGCLSRGGLHYRLTKIPKLSSYSGMKEFLFHSSKRREWKRLYKDSFDPELFRGWLKNLLIEKKTDFREGYNESPISEFAGLCTFRYLKIYNYNFLKKSDSITDFSKLVKFDKENNFVDIMLKMETLHESLIENAENMGISVEEMKDTLKNMVEKTNKSIRNNYHFYYDEETAELVKKKEQFIIEKYNYCFD